MRMRRKPWVRPELAECGFYIINASNLLLLSQSELSVHRSCIKSIITGVMLLGLIC